MKADDGAARLRLRWAVNISGWDPEAQEWQLLLGFLPKEEAASVQRFKFQADQKRALVSRWRAACCRVLSAFLYPVPVVTVRATGCSQVAAAGLRLPGPRRQVGRGDAAAHQGQEALLRRPRHR